MKIKCPYCGYDEELSEEYLGKVLECPCGKTFTVGQIEVAEEAFVNGNAIIQCPYCGSKNDLPREAINRNVRCCECDGKFCPTMQRKESSGTGRKNILFKKRKIIKLPPAIAESRTEGSCSISPVAKESYSYGSTGKSPFSLSGCGCICAMLAPWILIYITCSQNYSKSSAGGVINSRGAWEFPIYPRQTDLRVGDLFKISYNNLKIISVIKGGMFESDGVLFQPEPWYLDTLPPVYYVEGIDISNLSDGDYMPSILLRRQGTYTYTSGLGIQRTVKAFKCVRQN